MEINADEVSYFQQFYRLLTYIFIYLLTYLTYILIYLLTYSFSGTTKCEKNSRHSQKW